MRIEQAKAILGESLAGYTSEEQLVSLVSALALAAEQSEYVYTKFIGMSQMNNVLVDGLLRMPCECEYEIEKCTRCETLANALTVAEEFALDSMEGE